MSGCERFDVNTTVRLCVSPICVGAGSRLLRVAAKIAGCVRDQRGRSSPEDSPQAGLRTRGTTRVSTHKERRQGSWRTGPNMVTHESLLGDSASHRCNGIPPTRGTSADIPPRSVNAIKSAVTLKAISLFPSLPSSPSALSPSDL